MNNFKITKREILFSIIIFCVMLIIGSLIHTGISNNLEEKYERYNTAMQINNDRELFSYGMKTDIGHAFVYGELSTNDAVTYPEISGKYMYVEKVKEKYTMHTRTVTYTTGSGKTRRTHHRTETYWTWDKVDSENKKCETISFIGVNFPSDKIKMPSTERITVIKESSHIRYVYYGTSLKHIGTLYTELKNDTINNSEFMENKIIEEALESKVSGWQLIVFWIIWVLLIAVAIFCFYYFDNQWLEDR